MNCSICAKAKIKSMPVTNYALLSRRKVSPFKLISKLSRFRGDDIFLALKLLEHEQKADQRRMISQMTSPYVVNKLTKMVLN